MDGFLEIDDSYLDLLLAGYHNHYVDEDELIDDDPLPDSAHESDVETQSDNSTDEFDVDSQFDPTDYGDGPGSSWWSMVPPVPVPPPSDLPCTPVPYVLRREPAPASFEWWMGEQCCWDPNDPFDPIREWWLVPVLTAEELENMIVRPSAEELAEELARVRRRDSVRYLH